VTIACQESRSGLGCWFYTCRINGNGGVKAAVARRHGPNAEEPREGGFAVGVVAAQPGPAGAADAGDTDGDPVTLPQRHIIGYGGQGPTLLVTADGRVVRRAGLLAGC